jgi:RNA ligase (TIGR02306 family)
MNTQRKLATIKRITSVEPIIDADQIELIYVGGWPVVSQKGLHTVGSLVIYIEPDAWVPTELAPFLSKGQEPREYNGVKGERLKTIKLRGQISQGLLLPISEVINRSRMDEVSLAEDSDLTEFLGIQKWEAPIPAQLAGEILGLFPTFIPKTDQERIQNLGKQLVKWNQSNISWEVSEKLEGSSMTVYLNDGAFGVCSRNLDLKPSEFNSFWKAAIASDLEGKLRHACTNGRNLALQGELIGEGVEGNIYKLKGQQFWLYDVYDIDNRQYFGGEARQALAEDFKINQCPIIETSFVLNNHTIAQLLDVADGRSALADTKREGLVYKAADGSVSFKCISNKYLISQK